MRPRQSTLDRRRFLALGGATCLAVGAPSYARGAAALVSVSGSAFGARWSISLPAGTNVTGFAERLDALLAGLDLAFSPWRDDSVVARFNAGKAGDMVVSDEISSVTRSALAIAHASDGAFDPTVGPLVARWGFGPIHGSASRSGGWRGLSADNAHIAKAEDGLTLDLCGIAKGHAIDRILAILLDGGHEQFLIDLGGELAARGRHPSGRPWQLGVEHPHPGREDFAGILRLDNLAVATSGGRTNGYDIGRRRYSHIIDPGTREPVDSSLASVSVLMATAREADGWATALMSAGQRGPDIAHQQNLSALFLVRQGAGLRRIATGDFAARFEAAS